MIYIVKNITILPKIYSWYISSDISILQQVLTLKNIISQLDNKDTIVSVSFNILEVGRIVHALLKGFLCET